jgi:hypothetical protein
MTARARRLPRLAALLALLAALAAPGCAAVARRPPDLADVDYPGQLRPAGALAADVLWQQRVTVAWSPEEARGFDAAIQKLGDTLTVVGLSPVGTAGFVILLRDGELELRNETGADLPVPPRFIVLDIQRVFFPWLPAGGATPADGERAGVVDGERVVETWAGGRLRERRFTRLDGAPEGAIRIRYEWGDGAVAAPARAVLDSGWFGYRLTIDTQRETLLPAPGAGAP